MASINNITIKNLKFTEDHEGMRIWHCDVYKNGKKLGHASEDYYGGPAEFFFDEKLLDEEVKSYSQSVYVEDRYRHIVNAQIFITAIVRLTKDEKEWKKGIKRDGYYTFVRGKVKGCIYEGYHTNTTDSENILESEDYKNWIEYLIKKHNCKDSSQIKTTIYRDSSDFNVNTFRSEGGA